MLTKCRSEHAHTCVRCQKSSGACSTGESPAQQGNTGTADLPNTAMQQLTTLSVPLKAYIKRLFLTHCGIMAAVLEDEELTPPPRLTPSLSSSVERVVT